MHYRNKTISPKSFQVGLYHYSFSTGGSEKQRQRKCLTKSSVSSGLSQSRAVSVLQCPWPFTKTSSQFLGHGIKLVYKQHILISLSSPFLKPSSSLIL